MNRDRIKSWLDANIWECDDGSDFEGDGAIFTREALLDTICELVEDLELEKEVVEIKNVH